MFLHILGSEVLKSVWKLQLVIRLRFVKTQGKECITYGLKIGHMVAQVAARLASAIFGFITKAEIARPELCISERCQMSTIRPEHHGNNHSRECATRFSGRLL
jgi:hypothetical protein